MNEICQEKEAMSRYLFSTLVQSDFITEYVSKINRKTRKSKDFWGLGKTRKSKDFWGLVYNLFGCDLGAEYYFSVVEKWVRADAIRLVLNTEDYPALKEAYLDVSSDIGSNHIKEVVEVVVHRLINDGR